MKKQLTAALLVTLSFGASAQAAGSISLDARADFENNQFNDAAKASAPLLGIQSAAPQNNHRFNLQTLRVDFKGTLNEETTFRFRQRFNAGDKIANKSQRDSLNESVDFAYIQYRWFENFETQLGKFATDVGGIEGMTSSPDMYFTSQSYLEQTALRYQTGLKFLYKWSDQEIDLMATNQQTDADANGATAGGFEQNREAVGIVYKGSFMDKALTPVLSYHEDNLQSTTPGDRARKYSYYGAGLKYEMTPFFVELDYLYNLYKDKSFQDESDKTTSIVATLGYRMENWVFKLKGESSEAETFSGAGTSTKPKQNTYAAAFEYMPANEKNFRYHLAYVTRDVKPASGDTLNQQQMIAGVRIFADFLK